MQHKRYDIKRKKNLLVKFFIVFGEDNNKYLQASVGITISHINFVCIPFNRKFDTFSGVMLYHNLHFVQCNRYFLSKKLRFFFLLLVLRLAEFSMLFRKVYWEATVERISLKETLFYIPMDREIELFLLVYHIS